MKESVKVIRDGKYYVAKPVNVGGVVVQAETLPELNRKLTVIANSMLAALKQSVDNGFTFYEVADLNDELDTGKNPIIWVSSPNAGARCFRLKCRKVSNNRVTNQRDYIGTDRLMDYGMKTFNRYNALKGHEPELYEKTDGKWVRLTQTQLNKIYDEWKYTNKL